MRTWLKELTNKLKETHRELQDARALPMALSLAHKRSHELSRVLRAPRSGHCSFDMLARGYLPDVHPKLRESKSTIGAQLRQLLNLFLIHVKL